MSTPPESMPFTARAEGLLANLEAAVDRLADDFDIDVLRAGNVITLAFENGHKIIANSQAAAEEIWLAARSGGFHYRWDAAHSIWVDTRSGEDLRVALSKLIEIEVGVSPTLSL